MQSLLTDIAAGEEKVVYVHEGSKCAILDDTSEKCNPFIIIAELNTHPVQAKYSMLLVLK